MREWLLQTITKALGESFADTLLGAFWVWVFGLMVSAVLTGWAYLRGVKGPILYFAGGALSGIAVMVGLTIVLLWSKPAFYVIAATASLVLLVRWWASYRASEESRLSRYAKGFHDHMRDYERGQKRASRAMAAITRETKWQGKKAEDYTALLNSPLGQFRLGHQFIVSLAARSFRGSAARFNKQARALSLANQVVIASGEGIVAFSQETQNKKQVQGIKAAIEFMRAALGTTIPSQERYAMAVRGTPNMSQAYNAAKGELADAIDGNVVTFQELAAFCDRVLARLK